MSTVKTLAIETAEKAARAPFVPFFFVRSESDGRRILCQAMTPRCPMGSRSILIVADFGNGPESADNAEAFSIAGNAHKDLTDAAARVCDMLFQDVVNGSPDRPLTVTHSDLATIYEACRIALEVRKRD